MRFDPAKRRYVDKGRVLPSAEVKKHVTDYIDHEKNLTTTQAAKLLKGEITIDDFFAFMRHKITAWHQIAATIAYGGEDHLNLERQLRINEKIVSELTYLEGFQQDAEHSFTAVEIIANKVAELYPDAQAEIRSSVSRALMSASPSEASTVASNAVSEIVGGDAVVNAGPEAGFLMGAQIEPRSAMYADAIWATHETETLNRERDEGVTLGRRICVSDDASCDECDEAATEEFVPLDDLPEIGSLTCLNNCRCEFEFSVDGVEFATSDIFQGVVQGQDQYGGSVETQ